MLIPLLTALLLAPPAVADEWTPIAELTDEFDGDTLDVAKWHPRNPLWAGRQPGWFSPRNVAVDGGWLSLTMRHETLPDMPEGYHTFTAAAVKSRVRVLYGYFVARCKPMRSRGSSAFWFYHAMPEEWTEIDVFEIGGGAPGQERIVHSNVHVFRTPTETEHWAKPHQHRHTADLAHEFHDYGLLWTPERIVFSFDGEPIYELANTHWHQPLHLNFDTETMPDWFGLPEPATLPSVFAVDFVRAWSMPEVGRVIADEG